MPIPQSSESKWVEKNVYINAHVKDKGKLRDDKAQLIKGIEVLPLLISCILIEKQLNCIVNSTIIDKMDCEQVKLLKVDLINNLKK